MSKKISKIEKFNYQNIVTLNQSVADKRFLILDLWEDIRSGTAFTSKKTTHTADQNRYNQIFLQINDLRVLNFSDGKVYFDLTDRDDVVDAITSIEEKIMVILKNYLASIHKKGKFNFRSAIKDDRGDNEQGNIILALNLSNQDYEVTFYDIAKKRSNCSLVNKQGATFNIILELMYINFDMKKGEIVADTRMRMCMETRIKMMDVNMFIQDEKKYDNNHCDNRSDNRSDENQSRTQNVKSITQSFDITQTDVFDEDVVPENNTNFVKEKSKQNISIHSSTPTQTKNISKSFEDLEKENILSLNILDEILAPKQTQTSNFKQVSDPQRVEIKGGSMTELKNVKTNPPITVIPVSSTPQTKTSQIVKMTSDKTTPQPTSPVVKDTIDNKKPTAAVISVVKAVESLNENDSDDVFSKSSDESDNDDDQRVSSRNTQMNNTSFGKIENIDMNDNDDSEDQEMNEDSDDKINTSTRISAQNQENMVVENDPIDDDNDEIVESLDESENDENNSENNDDNKENENESEDELITEGPVQDQTDDATSDASNESDIMANLSEIYKQTEINRKTKKEVLEDTKPSIRTKINPEIKLDPKPLVHNTSAKQESTLSPQTKGNIKHDINPVHHTLNSGKQIENKTIVKPEQKKVTIRGSNTILLSDDISDNDAEDIIKSLLKKNIAKKK